MKIIPLCSSSEGNCYLIDDGSSVLMIECGRSIRQLRKLARAAGYAISGAAGCLISHEHKDHAQAWEDLVEDGKKVYASDGTIEALAADNDYLAKQMIPLAPEPGRDFSAPVTVGSYDVIAFRVFHDAKEPVGFLIRSSATGEKLVFATDTGNLRYRFPGVTHMMLEANFCDGDLMRNDRIDDARKARIRNTHMDIDKLCRYLKSLDLSQCREIWLMHLSDYNSNEYRFFRWVSDTVPDGCRVYVCPKELER